jgi:hypothetical protein
MTASLLTGPEIIHTQRLLLGIMPIDILQRDDLIFAVNLAIEGNSGIAISRHPSGRFSLSYTPRINDRIVVRLYDLQRRYIPRRLSFPLVTLSQILSIEQNHTSNYLVSRARKPMMFPGAAYPITGCATGLRGRVLLNSVVHRWPIVEVRSPLDPTAVLCRARGDDRGEFLLVIPPSAVPDVTLSQAVTFELTIYARPAPMMVDPANNDPFWDVPVELVNAVEADDPVTTGHAIPADYVASAVPVSVNFQLTRMMSSLEVNDIEFNPP